MRQRIQPTFDGEDVGWQALSVRRKLSALGKVSHMEGGVLVRQKRHICNDNLALPYGEVQQLINLEIYSVQFKVGSWTQ